jgi:hypothetical protein
MSARAWPSYWAPGRVAETTVIDPLAPARPASAEGVVGCRGAGKNIHVVYINAKTSLARTTEVAICPAIVVLAPLALSIPCDDQNRMQVRMGRNLLYINAVRIRDMSHQTAGTE